MEQKILETKEKEPATVSLTKCNTQTIFTWVVGILSEQTKGQPFEQVWAAE